MWELRDGDGEGGGVWDGIKSGAEEDKPGAEVDRPGADIARPGIEQANKGGLPSIFERGTQTSSLCPHTDEASWRKDSLRLSLSQVSFLRHFWPPKKIYITKCIMTGYDGDYILGS